MVVSNHLCPKHGHHHVEVVHSLDGIHSQSHDHKEHSKLCLRPVNAGSEPIWSEFSLPRHEKQRNEILNIHRDDYHDSAGDRRPTYAILA